MDIEHIMPEGYDGMKHVSDSTCSCAPALETKDLITGDEVWRHNQI